MQKSKYDISKSTAPAMLRLEKGTECVQLLLSQVSKDLIMITKDIFNHFPNWRKKIPQLGK